MIAAQLANLALPSARLATVVDDDSALDAALTSFSTADIVISTGGVSAGEHDLVRAALECAGARIVFHGIRMRPGKPILYAILSDGRPFFGLPGNPVAAFVGFRFFAVAALRAMLGLCEELGSVVSAPIPGRAGTTQYLRGRRTVDRDGRMVLCSDMDQRSHILSSAAQADCWLRVEEDGAAAVFEKYARFSNLGQLYWAGR